MASYIFVYGTLKRGHAFSGHLKGLEFVGKGKARCFTLLHLGGCPGLIPARGCDTAIGEVYKVPDAELPSLLRRLDRVENESVVFVRVKIRVAVGGGLLECTTYLYLPTVDEEHTVPGGEW